MLMCEVRWIWLFNFTFNDISVIYVTAHRCTGGLKKKLNLRSGSQRHIYFVGFFNVPIQAPTRDPPFYEYSEKPPHFSRFLRDAWGYGGHILDLNPPPPPPGGKCWSVRRGSPIVAQIWSLVRLYSNMLYVPSHIPMTKISSIIT